MLSVTFLTVGTLKESYLREASAEYLKRLGGFCRTELCELKEQKLPENPSEAEIRAALEKEGEKLLAAIPPKAYKIALCIEGKSLSSEQLAATLDRAATAAGSVCFLIGSSHGLAPAVKNACDLKLSLSALTFPHQLARVLLLEATYRALNILKGTKYHK